ncbi:MAG: transposase [Bdellovibrionales bacterium]|nr:transposase [Bdellovibrionales bacterium]
MEIKKNTSTCKPVRKRKSQQRILQNLGHGGVREGAGRKKSKNSGVSHSRRPELSSSHPLHITVKIRPGLPSLRTKKCHQALRYAIRRAKEYGLRVIHFAILSNHVHLIVEVKEKHTLSIGMQSLGICFSKAINRLCHNKGSVFKDRYHAVILKTPTQLKRALIYVFENAAKHAKKLEVFDFYSTLCLFNEWKLLFFEKRYSKNQKQGCRKCLSIPKIQPEKLQVLSESLSKPQTWLLKSGWMRAL